MIVTAPGHGDTELGQTAGKPKQLAAGVATRSRTSTVVAVLARPTGDCSRTAEPRSQATGGLLLSTPGSTPAGFASSIERRRPH